MVNQSQCSSLEKTCFHWDNTENSLFNTYEKNLKRRGIAKLGLIYIRGGQENTKLSSCEIRGLLYI